MHINGRAPVCDRICSSSRQGRVNIWAQGAKPVHLYIFGRPSLLYSVGAPGEARGLLAWEIGGVRGAVAMRARLLEERVGSGAGRLVDRGN